MFEPFCIPRKFLGRSVTVRAQTHTRFHRATLAFVFPVRLAPTNLFMPTVLLLPTILFVLNGPIRTSGLFAPPVILVPTVLFGTDGLFTPTIVFVLYGPIRTNGPVCATGPIWYQRSYLVPTAYSHRRSYSYERSNLRHRSYWYQRSYYRRLIRTNDPIRTQRSYSYQRSYSRHRSYWYQQSSWCRRRANGPVLLVSISFDSPLGTNRPLRTDRSITTNGPNRTNGPMFFPTDLFQTAGADLHRRRVVGWRAQHPSGTIAT